MLYVLKTVPGLEDLLAEECKSVEPNCEPLREERGRLLVELSREGAEKLVQISRLLTSAYEVLAETELVSLSPEGVRSVALEIEWERILHDGAIFAVRSERVGEHSFTSLDVSREVGRAVFERCASRGVHVKVHLNAPEVVVIAELFGSRLTIGVSLTGDSSLHRRWYRVREHPASLKPPIAFAMIMLSGMRDGELLIDPMCGGGTIPIEALLYFETSRAVCGDVSEESLRIAKHNAAAAGVLERLETLRSDVRDLPSLLGRRIAKRIVTNPPYGIRLGTPRASAYSLAKLFDASNELLTEDGSLVLITPSRKRALEEAERIGMRLYCEREVLHGDLRAWILCFESSSLATRNNSPLRAEDQRSAW
ncbi:MAG: THUMP domain-containing protein [Fervidicoccaceae archaeon]